MHPLLIYYNHVAIIQDMWIMKIHFTKLFCDRRYKINRFIFQI